MTRRIVVLGDALLDRDIEGESTRLCPDAPVPVVDVHEIHASPGGAGLTALLCAQAGSRGGASATVTLIAPVADDDDGRRLVSALGEVHVVPLGHEGPTRRKTRVRSADQTLLRVDEGGPGTPLDVDGRQLRELLDGADAVLVADYGGGVTRDSTVRSVLTAHAAAGGTIVWDPHPRGGRPIPGCALVTPNLSEAGALLRSDQPPDLLASGLRSALRAKAVAVTAGREGAYLSQDDARPTAVACESRAAGGRDSCGAGDRFSSTAALALAGGCDVETAVREAVGAATAWVAAGGAAGFRQSRTRQDDATAPRRPASGGGDRLPVDVRLVLERVRARGGSVVATGGCFDLLHAGHIECLESARALGDSLIVLLNSDSSVTRLKGPGRPVNTAADRARVLSALACVDAVVEFDEDDPRALLGLIRPDVWVKGGDYQESGLTEAPDIRAWGGRVAVLPYLDGRSTTALLQRMSHGR
ncbi:D-glycero-beta-D-manno-heptose 1-phosphate adenylyltransferase [Cumulibacter manganitolerans]|uniref:D-glycero-beta-D-manno-heptose 1-phosphate adenylyltransferase n=1 Tax=Cumulibacter manganitolerans TaxID=1884992 RepID=UPI00129606E7|nr:D-glycero-beta-D-manno-heptose 1-phosphate adenylyltransferase [Cumulibacter manganitolerans]